MHDVFVDGERRHRSAVVVRHVVDRPPVGIWRAFESGVVDRHVARGRLRPAGDKGVGEGQEVVAAQKRIAPSVEHERPGVVERGRGAEAERRAEAFERGAAGNQFRRAGALKEVVGAARVERRAGTRFERQDADVRAAQRPSVRKQRV